MIPFATIAGLAMEQGLEALACIPVPERLDPAGLDAMLADGVGELGWLEETRDLRLSPTAFQGWATRLVCTAMPYQPEAGDGELRRGRYAAGKDYHLILRKKLAMVARRLAETTGRPQRQRACADSAPLNERTLARLAGLGWIGRNGLLISPDAGSYRLLGFLFLADDIELRRGPHGADRCGRCTRCVDACPTAALVAGRVLTTRCISYLTIEHQGVIPRDLAARFQGWWFGCDVCQEVCPWNRFAGPAADPRLTGRESDEALLAVTADTFDLVFAGRAVRRLSWAQYRRNLLVAAWSLGRRDWVERLRHDDLPLVRAQVAELALDRPGGPCPPCV